MTSEHENPSKSRDLFDSAREIMPGGISRNTIYREPHPDYLAAGKGCHVTDMDGITRVDFANNMGSLIHGHATPQIISAVTEQLGRGSAVTMATQSEFELARLLCLRVSGFEKIRFMNSGTEAVMAALKAARAITGRSGIAKAEGTYHGTYDFAEISQNAAPHNWGDLEKPNSVPVARGTPAHVLNDVVIFPFNDTQRTLKLLDQSATELACVLIDLVPQRAGLIPAHTEYIKAIREWTTRHNVLLIFDEVISFRMGFAGAAEWYDVQPDLTTLGKIIGGGFPVGALAGLDRFMSVLDPAQKEIPFPWSGTFSANPVTMTAGHIAMAMYDQVSIDRINQIGQTAREMINDLIAETGVKASVTGAGSMFRIHPKAVAPTDYRSTWQTMEERHKTKLLVEHLYRHGFMMFRTCTAALSTPISQTELDQFSDVLKVGLEKFW
ncbi:MAG: aminotransferase class III-fold pyridoxal phosphate-dependent enzyme [Pirellulaceae bacterium]|nr:aminotransferase class III-fold pyridoxal phosphate-dependent enzyme [Pirellulaceae bacterium]